MIVCTTESVAGHRVVRTMGPAFGIVVRSRGIAGNLMASLRTVLGGEVHEYTAMLQDARIQALERLKADARRQGGNAVVCMRFCGSEIGQSMSEVAAYGTAALVEPVPGP